MLTQIQVDEYREKGFTVYPNLLDTGVVAAYLAEIEEISSGNTLSNHDSTLMEMEPDQAPEGTQVRRLYEPCTNYESFKNLARADHVLDCVEQLVGPDIIFHYSKVNMKPAKIGSVVEWHQDLTYYPLTNRDSLAVLFYLDDTDEENGCLQMIPGQHLEGIFEHSTDGYFQGRVVDNLDDTAAVSVPAAAGTAIFMHAMTPHASVTNRSSRSRRTLILSYRAADAVPLLTGVTPIIEENAVLVRGNHPRMARFTMTEFPVPLYREEARSLYQLQEKSRERAKG